MKLRERIGVRLREAGSRVRWLVQPGDNLGQRTANAGAWAFALSMSNRLLATARTIVIARFLAPTDIGLMGIALLLASLVQTFTQTGFRAALIQRKDDIADDLDTAWTIEVGRSLLIGGVLALAAPWLADFFSAPGAIPVIQVMGLAVFVGGFQNIAVLTFDKELDFQRRFVYRSIPALVDLAVAATLAVILQNVWALVLGVLARRIALVIASYVVLPYRPRLHVDWAKAKGLYNFGMWIFGSSILGYAMLNLDDIVVGRVLGAASLGFYQLAFTVSQVATTELTLVVNKVAFPAYSKLQDAGDRLRRAYLRTMQIVALVSFPMTVGLWYISEQLVQVVLEPRWLPMVPALNVLLLWGLIRSILATTGPLFEGMGRPSIPTKVLGAQVVILAIAIFPMTSTWGIVGAAWATVIAAVIPDTIAVAIATRVVGARAWDVVSRLLYPLLASLLMLAVLYTVESLLGPTTATTTLFWAPAVGIVVYVLAVRVMRSAFGYTADGILPRMEAGPS